MEISILLLELYVWVLIVGAVLSWLTAFDVVNAGNRVVSAIGEFCFKVTEPVLRHVRRFVPVMGGMDLSPIVVIFAVIFLQSFLRNLMVSFI